MKTIHNEPQLISDAIRLGFSYGIAWYNHELGNMIDLFTFPVKGSKKLK